MSGLVSRIVEGVSNPRPAGAALATKRSNYFAVGGQLFSLAIGTDHPYERATAPYRKEQLDTGSSAGDQSLSGWWTRGQFTFHRGAGIDYYELLDGDTVAGRFNDSLSVDPWTPGEVRLTSAVTTLGVGTGVKAACPVASSTAGQGSYLFLVSGTLKEVADVAWSSATVSSVTVAGAVTPRDVASFGSTTAYVAAGTAVHSYTYGAGTTASLRASSDSRTVARIWCVKDRLLVLDTLGQFYVLAATSGSFSLASDKFTTFTTVAAADYDTWRVTEVPSGWLMGSGDRLWHVGLDTSATTPTPGQPVEALRLPQGETIGGLTYTAGRLVVATSKGVRVGLVGNDGSVSVGPLIVEGTFYTRGIAADGTLVHVPGVVKDVPALWTFNLSEEVEELVPAYAKTRSMPNLVAGADAGAFTSKFYGKEVRWWAGAASTVSAGNIRSVFTDAATTGTVTTGYHRFGTLEPKAFRSVKVVVGGSGGTVGVARVSAGGAVVPLLTVPAEEGGSVEVSLGSTAPEERVALKFTLTSTTGVGPGPKLLGYQIRAVPSPTRQRLIRVPLNLYDSERTGGQRASGGDPWERLAALEDLESSSSLVTFQDFRTGETGVANIETIEFAGVKPPSSGGGNFGGIVTITLRKVG